MDENDQTILEASNINDLFAEGFARIEILGDNVRMVFWRWRRDGDGWRKIELDWAIVMPLRGLDLPIEKLPNVQIVRPGTPSTSSTGRLN